MFKVTHKRSSTARLRIPDQSLSHSPTSLPRATLDKGDGGRQRTAEKKWGPGQPAREEPEEEGKGRGKRPRISSRNS